MDDPTPQNLKRRSVHDVLTDREDNSDPTDLNGPSPYTAHSSRRTSTHRVKPRKFFYDAQIARLMTQIGVKCFGGYQVMTGLQEDGAVRLKDVPVVYGGWDRVASQLAGGISDNVVPSLPIISYTLTSMTRKLAEIRDPMEVQQYVVRMRARDPDGNLLVNQPGKYIVIERYMPVPYDIDVDVAIWSSNTDQLMQLIEQFGTAFNPDLEVGVSESPLDWTSPTRLLFKNTIQFSEEAITPSAKLDPMRVAQMQFSTTARLSLPVRVYDAALIHEIDVNVRELEDWGYFYFGDNIDIATMPLLDNLRIEATPQEIVDHNNQ